MSEAKKQNYLHGAAIMVGTTVIVKIAAFFYKLPLGSMKLLGDEGFAHFMVAYNIYSFFLTLATAGFPVALSRMISEADTLDRPAQVQRIFRTAAGTLAAIGGFFTLMMLLFNRQLAVMMGNADAAPSILALAPAVVIVCLTSAYRGYCQGRGNMIPTAFGQVIEEVGKLVVGLTLAFLLIRAHKPLPLASAGAIFGVTAGAVQAPQLPTAALRHGGYPRQPRYDRPVISAHRHSDRHRLLGALAHQSARQRALSQPAAVRRRVRGEKRPRAVRRIRQGADVL